MITKIYYFGQSKILKQTIGPGYIAFGGIMPDGIPHMWMRSWPWPFLATGSANPEYVQSVSYYESKKNPRLSCDSRIRAT